MEKVLILYAICASALVIWSTKSRCDALRQRCGKPASKRTISYLAIPSFLLHEWAKCYPELVIFKVCPVTERNARHDDIPGTLTVSKGDLPNLLGWLAPNSMVVLSCGDDIERFDTQIERALLQLGIETIYLLDDGVNFPLTVTWEDGVLRERLFKNEKQANRAQHSLRGDKG